MSKVGCMFSGPHTLCVRVCLWLTCVVVGQSCCLEACGREQLAVIMLEWRGANDDCNRK